MRVDVLDEFCGQWRLIAGGAVDPVPTEVLSDRPGLEVRDDGRTSDLGQLMRLRSGGDAGLGLVEVDVSDDTTVGGLWRAYPTREFLADTRGGHGGDYGEFFRPRPWLRDAVWAGVEDGELTLRDLGEPQGLMTDEDWWPLPGPLPRDRPYFLLCTEYDPTDMSMLRVCSVSTRAAHVTAGAPPGSVWMLADQVYRLAPGIGADAEPVDVATLLDQTQHTKATSAVEET